MTQFRSSSWGAWSTLRLDPVFTVFIVWSFFAVNMDPFSGFVQVFLCSELRELGITFSEFARQIEVPANRIPQIIRGKRAITGDTALRFGHWFRTDAQFWINLQAQFNLAVVDQATGEQIKKLPTRATYAARPQDEQPRLL